MKMFFQGLVLLICMTLVNAQDNEAISPNPESESDSLTTSSIPDTITEKSLPENAEDDVSFPTGDEAQDETSTEGESFVNPFVTDEDQEGDAVKENPFVAEESQTETTEIAALSFDDDEKGLDVIMDLSIGLGLPRVEIEPNYIGSKGKPDFLFRGGILLPFTQLFFASLSFQYLQLSFDLDQRDTVSLINKMIILRKGTESLTFLAIPIKLGLRFGRGPVKPYIYADAEPSFLIAGNQNTMKNVTTHFADSSIDEKVYITDIDVTDKRNRILAFAGMGVGCEITYGYGSVYIDASLQYNPLNMDRENTFDEGFRRTSSKAFYVPILLGIRFYL